MVDLSRVRAAEVQSFVGTEGRTRVASPAAALVDGLSGLAGAASGLAGSAAKAKQDAIDAAAEGAGAIAGTEESVNLLVSTAEQEMRAMQGRVEEDGLTLDADTVETLTQVQREARALEYYRTRGELTTASELQSKIRQVELMRKRPDLAPEIREKFDLARSSTSTLLSQRDREADEAAAQVAARQNEVRTAMRTTLIGLGQWRPDMSDAEMASAVTQFQPVLGRRAELQAQLAETNARAGITNVERTEKARATLEEALPGAVFGVSTALAGLMGDTQMTNGEKLIRWTTLRNAVIEDAARMFPSNPEQQAAYRDAQLKLFDDTRTVIDGTDTEGIARRRVIEEQSLAWLRMQGTIENFAESAIVIKDLGPMLQAALGADKGAATLYSVAAPTLEYLSGLRSGGGVPDPLRSPGRPAPPKGEVSGKASSMADMLDAITKGIDTTGVTPLVKETGAAGAITYLKSPTMARDAATYGRFIERVAANPKQAELFKGSPYSAQLEDAGKTMVGRVMTGLEASLTKRYSLASEQLYNVQLQEDRLVVSPVPGSPLQPAQALEIQRYLNNTLRAYAHLTGSTDYQAALQALAGAQ